MSKKRTLLDIEEFNIDTLQQKDLPTVPITLTDKSPKKKAGRPKVKTEPTKTVNIAISISTLEKMEIAKSCFDKNLTKYINTIIEKDLETNFDRYQEVANYLETINSI